MSQYEATPLRVTQENEQDENSNALDDFQNKITHIQQLREKRILKPNWPSFCPILHYNPSELVHPFDDLVRRSFQALLFLIFSYLYNIFALTQIDLSCFSFNRSLFLSLIQGFAAVYFCYAFSFRYIYCASIIKHIPYRFIFYQFALIFWNIYVIIGFCQTGFAGLSTLFNASFENGQDDYLSICVITSNCIISIISLILNCLTLYSASNARQIPHFNFNKTKN